MSELLHPALLARLSDLLVEQTGLNFPRERWRDLDRGLRSACKDFGFDKCEDCLRWLTTSRLDKHQIEILAGHLTVGETYFFRDKKSYEVLAEHLLPPLIEERRKTDKRLRIWSAACCTGEEPYSIAITLSRMLPDWKDWRITVLATDLNPRFLQHAAKGVFRDWAFRGTPPEMKEQFFRRTSEGFYELLPQLRDMVKFEYLNLAEDIYPSLLNDTNAMDIIFCRNVLIYFQEEAARKVINQLYRCLVSGGYLLTSPSEAMHVHFAEFETLHYPGAIVYRKSVGETTRSTPNNWSVSNNWSTSEAWSTPGSLGSVPLDIAAPTIVPLAPPVTPFEPAIVPPLKPPEYSRLDTTPPPPAWVSIDRARELYDAGRYDDAIALLEQMPDSAIGEGQALALLARAHANSGQLNKALEAATRAIAANKMNPAFHYLRATILQENDAFDEAVAALKRALYLNHDFVMAHFALGNLALSRKRPAEANRHFHNTLVLLDGLEQETLLPESEGITAGRLAEIIDSMSRSEI